MAGADCDEYICSNDKDEKQLQQVLSKSPSTTSSATYTQKYPEFKQKPLNAIDLGRSAWPMLHRFTLGYPENPNESQKQRALSFIQSFSQIYPCKICRIDFQEEIKKSPPMLDSRENLIMWMCEQHNLVNEKLMKDKFRCNVRRIEIMYGGSHRKPSSWDNIQ
eukprot:403342236